MTSATVTPSLGEASFFGTAFSMDMPFLLTLGFLAATSLVNIMANTHDSDVEGDVFKKFLNQDRSDSGEMMKSCFQVFDQDRDGVLNLKEFHSLTRALFCDENGKPYPVEESKVEEMFCIFDTNKDGRIDYEEFRICWNNWIKMILSPVSALVIVDIQNDFISGTLALKNCPAAHNAEEVVPATNSLIDSIPFDLIVYSWDWHPENHVSFFENVHLRKLHESSKVSSDEAKAFDTVVFEGPPLNEQILWPAHCVQGSWGAQLHSDLKVANNALHIYKGTNPEIDSYSAFWDNNKLSETSLRQELLDRNVTDVYCCGVAYDMCVGSTATHALEHGFRTVLISDACRGIDEHGIAKMRDRLINHNGVVCTSDKVRAMVLAKDRRPELGYQAALQVAKKLKDRQ